MCIRDRKHTIMDAVRCSLRITLEMDFCIRLIARVCVKKAIVFGPATFLVAKSAEIV